ncbi:carboxypeptidase-like regulatory domain-containing protein [bacterium]|nr:carboxypeptidase-like regulatory domain-containing protein [bacterium]MBU1064469.1 carboxypeptidase-like regulatory domain-containing protein [bacterium]MBU1635724.1 carboxypeptidase-like regulatory domain-containing protein [bacterium]MBU1872630.1 carboxypeptidase-like regulatory domain-containing protein [bacterium]
MKDYYIFFGMLILFVFGCDLLDEKIIDISGKITDEGSAVSSAIVLLVESADISDGLNLASGSISNSAGKYTIQDVDPGDYYVLAIDDKNDNLQFDSDIDQLGFYGVNPDDLDFLPNKISVEDTDLEGINIVDLYSLE